MELVKQNLTESRYLAKVMWRGDSSSASVGLGIALNVNGQITDDEVVIEKCVGGGGPTVLSKIGEALRKKFPNGRV